MLERLLKLFRRESEPSRIDRYRELQARHPSDGLTATLATRDGGLPLTLTVTNPTDVVGQFCVYHTPFEGIANAWLEVLGEDGAVMEYRGVMMSRLAPGPEHFIILQPGETRSAEFDPSEAFQLGAGV